MNTTNVTIIFLSVISLILFILLILEKKKSQMYWWQWNHFETKYSSLYGDWVKRLSPDELKRIQQNSIDREKESWQVLRDPPLDKPI